MLYLTTYLIIFVVVIIFCYGSGENKCVRVNTAVESSIQQGTKAKWAIVALTKHGRHDISIRNNAIVNILKPFAHLHDITAIFFSESKFPVSTIDSAKAVFKPVGEVKFINTADRGFSGKERFGYKVV